MTNNTIQFNLTDMAKSITVRLPNGIKEKLERRAKQDFRTVHNLVIKMLHDHFENEEVSESLNITPALSFKRKALDTDTDTEAADE